MDLDDLQPASFQGVRFYVQSSTLQGGRRVQVHHYPNSDNQSVEDLGLSPRDITVKGRIHSIDYIANRDSLLRVLENGKSGVLEHPWYGRLPNYKVTSYTLTESLAALGDAQFSINFKLDDTEGIPIESQSTLNKLGATRDSALDIIEDNFIISFIVSNKYVGNFTHALNKAKSVVSALTANTNQFAVSAGSINDFSRNLRDTSASLTGLISSPTSLVNRVRLLFDSLTDLYDTAENRLNIFRSFFDFGDSDPEVKRTTAGLEQRANNQDYMNRTVQGFALAYAYFESSQRQYSTATELNDISNVLEIQYKKIMDSPGLNQESKNILSDMRTEVVLYLNEQKLDVKQLISVKSDLTAISPFTYRYYGELDSIQNVIELNNFDEVTFIEGPIQVISE